MTTPGRRSHHCRLQAVLAASLVAACGGDTTEPPPRRPVPVATTVLLTPASATITAIDDTLRFSADVRDQEGQPMTGVAITWRSSDLFVATVNAVGVTRATGNGTATITATVSGVSGTAALTVEQQVAAVAVSPDSSVLVVGETLPLVAAIVDANGHPVQGAQVAWASGDTTVVTVDESGRVTAASVGRTTITAVSDEVVAEVSVAVLPTPVSMAIAPLAIEFASLGDTVALTATALDAEGNEIEGLAFVWSSTDTTVASVDALGRVVSVDNGTVDVTAARAAASAVITARIAQVAESLEVLPAVDTVAVGDSIALIALAADANGYTIAAAAAPAFDWTSATPELVAVDATGLAAALAPGVAAVTASAGDLEATSSLTVEAAAAFDKRILATLFEATSGLTWARSDNWLTDAPAEDWHGVGVDDNGRVARVDLSANRLAGTIPPQLGDLRSLRSLNFLNNALIGQLPEELSNLERLDSLLLSSNDLTGTIPTWLAEMPSLRLLALSFNELTGPIPKELSRLPVIERLYLTGNALVGEIPPELGSLSTLSFLYLGNNDLEGGIPPELGNLTNLRRLILRSNQLTGPIPPELGHLTSLERLELYYNGLTGEIPRELSDLSNLAVLGLLANRFTGEIPPELGNLTSLTHLYLGRNQLTGSIPPELGNLASLEMLDLLSNQIGGPLPPELGRLAALEHLILSRNRRLEGELPREFTALSLDELQLGATGLCAPQDDEFRAWVASIGTGWAPLCAEERTHAYLMQASQSASVPVKLVAGEQALLRVFVVANSGVSASFPAVRARFFADGREVHSVSLPGSSRPLPTAVDESSLDASANALIPASVLVPGLELVVDIDPEGALPAGTGVPRRWPEEGRAALDVRRMRPLDLTLVPFLYNSNPDRALADRVKLLRAQDELFELTRDLLPVEEFTVTAREPVWTSIDPVFDNSSALLRETWATRTMDGASGYYMGVMRGGGGRGYVGWPGSVSGLRGPTIAHELGHNMSLRHAPCGDPSNIELIYPYVNGSIGSWGYDFQRGLLISPTRPDFMSYCGPEWVSDYSFNKALHFRETLEPQRAGSPATAVADAQGLLLWGGQGADSVPILEPAFVVQAPPSLPPEEGPFRLAGLTVREDTLFLFSFAMPETGLGDGESAFAFVLPTQDGWADSLDRIVLIGPGGSDAVGRGDAGGLADTAGGEAGGTGQQFPGRASVLLIDGTSGRARGFLRDSPGQPLTLPGTSLRLPEPGLEAVVSRGVPDSAAWRR